MKKRIKRIRGTRTCGGGSAKKRRGKGSKGGSGHAGAFGHHVVWSLKHGIIKGHNASVPFRYDRREVKTVNIGELDELLEELVKDGKAEAKADGFYLDAGTLGIEKILGAGQVTKKLQLKASSISKAAREKIEQVGGSVELGEEARVEAHVEPESGV
ncbi:MAG: uL15 family ribosomal protein [Candidatus Methanospirareceae archaeon]